MPTARKMNDYWLAGMVDQEISQADGWDSDELATNRENALNYFFGRPAAAPGMAGRSQVQSLDVADMHSAVLAAMMPAFEIENLVAFEATSEEDIDQARQESEAVNYMVMQENDGYMLFKQSIHDALLLRNGLVKIWIDERQIVSTERFEGLTDIEAFQRRQPQENTDTEVLKDERASDGLRNLTVRYTKTVRKLRLTSTDPTLFIWSKNHDSLSLADVSFCAERMYPSRSELINMGYDKKTVNELQASTGKYKSGGDATARNVDSLDPTWQAQQRAQDLIEMYDVYYRVDVDDDGIAELRNLFYASGSRVFLENEPVKFVPYASGTAWINPHRFTGISMYDRMKEVQDAKTRTLRQWLDNHNNANNARIGYVSGGVNLEDLMTPRPAGLIEMYQPDALMPVPVTDVGGSCQAALDYLDTVRSERGGASLDLQTQAANIVGETAHGIERQFSSREQQTADILRTLSETMVKETYKLVHQAMREWLPGNVQIRARDQFQTVKPADWPERERVNVKTGLTESERRNKMTTIEAVIGKQEQYIGQGFGGIMTDAGKVHNAIEDWSLFSGIDTPERYWIDPTSEPAIAAAKQKAQQAEQEQAKMDKLASDAISVPAQIEGAKLVESAEQDDQELRLDYARLAADIETKEAELVAKAAVELMKNEDRPEPGEAAG